VKPRAARGLLLDVAEGIVPVAFGNRAVEGDQLGYAPLMILQIQVISAIIPRDQRVVNSRAERQRREL